MLLFCDFDRLFLSHDPRRLACRDSVRRDRFGIVCPDVIMFEHTGSLWVCRACFRSVLIIILVIVHHSFDHGPAAVLSHRAASHTARPMVRDTRVRDGCSSDRPTPISAYVSQSQETIPYRDVSTLYTRSAGVLPLQ